MDLRSPLGLALGGGGVRGGAHIGLLKVLDREGIEVGCIAGTSAGGLVGGLYAAGLPAVEIEALLLSLAPAALVELDRSGWSLLGTTRLVAALRERIGDERIEALPRPFAAVAVDLRTCREVLLAAGPLLRAIQATIAIPGVFCPVARDGALLVDGGVLNNVPVDVARKLGARQVLAVHLGRLPSDAPPEIAGDGPVFGRLPATLPRLLDRALCLSGRRRAMDVAGRSIGILTAALCAARLRECPPDLLLRPALAMGALDLERLPEAIAAGERLAEAHLDEICRLAG
ncbi:MAG TPA: patatin-like phospholipase family protein [Anaerolineae bacterium]|nr:patatin-like phospholipase family protein [Anaerolineae bacterium]